MKLSSVPISSVRPAKYNPRVSLQISDKEYQNIRNNLQKFGLVRPLVVNKRTGNLVEGHQRLQVLKDVGEKMVHIVHVEGPDGRLKGSA